MKTKGIVLVCGLGRSGTNSVSQYLHVSDDVFMFSSGLLEPKDFSDLKMFAKRGNPQRHKEIYISEEYQEITRFMLQKNDDFYKNKVAILDQYSYVGQRVEEIERRSECLERLSRLSELKLIFCVRKDFEALYMSRRDNKQPHSIEQFRERMVTTFRAVRKLKEEGAAVCSIDVSDTDNTFGSDYVRINELLGISMSDRQKWWQQYNPRTHRQPKETLLERTKDKVIFDDDMYLELRKEYNLTRAIL